MKTSSPINQEKIKGQNRLIYDTLQERNITCYDAIKLGVFHLNSRISDLRNRNNVTIHDRMVRVEGINMKEYSLQPYEASVLPS